MSNKKVVHLLKQNGKILFPVTYTDGVFNSEHESLTDILTRMRNNYTTLSDDYAAFKTSITNDVATDEEVSTALNSIFGGVN